jgi:O-antigen/teichoic acid export membrane protein
MRDAVDSTATKTPAAVVRGAGLLGLGMIYQQAISFVSGLVVARLLGAADYGIFNIVRDLANDVVIFTKAGLDIGLNRRLGERLSTESTLQAGGIIAAAVTAVLMLGTAWALLCQFGLSDLLERHVYRHDGFAQVMSLMMWIVPLLSALQVMTAGFRARLFPGPGVVGEMFIQPTIRLGMSVLLILLGWGVGGIVWANVFGAFAGLAFVAWHAHRHFGLARKALSELPWRDLWQIRRYSLVLAVSVALATLSRSIDILILGKFVSAAEVGRYAVVQMASLLLTLFGAAFGQMLGPQIAQLWAAGSRDGVAHLMQQNTRLILITTAPLFMVLACFGQGLMLVFGRHYAVDPRVIVLLSGSQLLVAVFANAGWVLSMTGRHVAETMSVGIGLVVAVVLHFLLIPAFGAPGAACATLLSILLANTVRMAKIYRYTGILLFRRELLPLALYAAAPALLVRLTMEALRSEMTLLTGMAASTAYLLLYAGIMLRFGLNAGERRWVKERSGSLWKGALGKS